MANPSNQADPSNKTLAATGLIAFQGAEGANSDLACRAVYPDMDTLACITFEDTFSAVSEGRADLAMIPVDNSLAGRVADIHHLLPESGLHVIGEHFQKIDHYLLAPKGASLDSIEKVHSHIHALAQCRKYIKAQGLTPITHVDTAGAAAEIADLQDTAQAAIASPLAAQIYDLEILAKDIQDADHNTTRFLIMAREPGQCQEDGQIMTSLIFRVRSVPAALYKALGGFATNGVNITKLESYVDASFQVAVFYADVEGHPETAAMKHALEELDFFSHEVRILGVYPAAAFRKTE